MIRKMICNHGLSLLRYAGGLFIWYFAYGWYMLTSFALKEMLFHQRLFFIFIAWLGFIPFIPLSWILKKQLIRVYLIYFSLLCVLWIIVIIMSICQMSFAGALIFFLLLCTTIAPLIELSNLVYTGYMASLQLNSTRSTEDSVK